MYKKFLSLSQEKRQKIYSNENSILKEYDEYLESNGIYHSLNRNVFEKSIKGRIELCEVILMLYNKAKLENERIVLLEDLAVIGYDKNNLVELILNAFYSENRVMNLWEYADLLYSIKNYNYMTQYIDIIKDKTFGESRQMLVLLVGKSKNAEVIPILMDLLNDSSVYGHALEALSNFKGDLISCTMRKYLDCDTLWIRKIAQKYLSKYP